MPKVAREWRRIKTRPVLWWHRRFQSVATILPSVVLVEFFLVLIAGVVWAFVALVWVSLVMLAFRLLMMNRRRRLIARCPGSPLLKVYLGTVLSGAVLVPALPLAATALRATGQFGEPPRNRRIRISHCDDGTGAGQTLIEFSVRMKPVRVNRLAILPIEGEVPAKPIMGTGTPGLSCEDSGFLVVGTYDLPKEDREDGWIGSRVPSLDATTEQSVYMRVRGVSGIADCFFQAIGDNKRQRSTCEDLAAELSRDPASASTP